MRAPPDDAEGSCRICRQGSQDLVERRVNNVDLKLGTLRDALCVDARRRREARQQCTGRNENVAYGRER